ncbi:PHP domain-containing protein [Oceanirhabdus sp. W0125-5]|uniref:PHP domain-containing protein n=1 Tax=Oceanirhabdus sp. W0125-5 TaxID=2999116 RepID=UPI0022F300B1|nr:PHP domain-containing protein [Oceanirhabdus sp. W0125-5]WBW99107.1 PHP-associated domain-containing protein [Oceanirhabdus sp. W0125-5]
MKIDMHVHAKERSSCSIASEKEHIEKAIEFGLDAIIFTDHNKLVPLDHLKELNKKYSPFKIFGGIEVRMKDNGEDVLILGIHDKLIEEREWTYPELYKFVRERNGYIAKAHPYRYKEYIEIDIENYIPDALEIHSTNIGKDDTKLISNLAQKLNCNLISNSDAHNSKDIGIYYNELESTPKNEKELIEILKSGKYTCGYCPERVYKFNKNVAEREEIIRNLIKEGKNKEYYHKLTGNWEGEFDRVLIGKSYII